VKTHHRSSFPPTTTPSYLTQTSCVLTLFDSEYYIGDTEKIETTEALQAPDSEHFIIAIKKEVHSLISETRTLQPITRSPGGGYVENSDNKRTWKIRTTLKCKAKR
jgi:hypothetical protein